MGVREQRARPLWAEGGPEVDPGLWDVGGGAEGRGVGVCRAGIGSQEVEADGQTVGGRGRDTGRAPEGIGPWHCPWGQQQSGWQRRARGRGVLTELGFVRWTVRAFSSLCWKSTLPPAGSLSEGLTPRPTET